MRKIVFKTFSKIMLGLIVWSFVACGEDEKQEIKFKLNDQGLFEGEIVLNKKRGNAKTEIRFTISDSLVTRQEIKNGFLTDSDRVAGIIIDLEQDLIVLYINDDASQQFVKLSDKMLGNDVYEGIKSTMSIAEYKSLFKNQKFGSNEDVSAHDYMFSHLNNYEEWIQIKMYCRA